MFQVEKSEISEARRYLEEALSQYEIVLLLTDADAGFNQRLCRRFAEKLTRRQRECGREIRALVLSAGEEESRPAYEQRKVPAALLKGILTLYQMYEFTDRLIIGSLSKPYGRRLCHLLESGLATEEEITDEILLRNI